MSASAMTRVSPASWLQLSTATHPWWTCSSMQVHHGWHRTKKVTLLVCAPPLSTRHHLDVLPSGEYASGSGHKHVVEQLLDFAVRSELLLRAASQSALPAPPPSTTTPYLEQRLAFRDGVILDEQGEAVMMGWERPLMVRHAARLCQSGGDILNVGFGLGMLHGQTTITMVDHYPYMPTQESLMRKYKSTTHVPIQLWRHIQISTPACSETAGRTSPTCVWSLVGGRTSCQT